MRNILFLFIFTICSTIVYSQKLKTKEVPPKVVASLTKQFPDSKKESWSMENENYHVTFESIGKKGSANFSNKGRFVSSIIQITKDDLPFSVNHYLKQKHADEKITSREKLKDEKNAISYKVITDIHEIIFDQQGQFTSSIKTSTVEELETAIDSMKTEE